MTNEGNGNGRENFNRLRKANDIHPGTVGNHLMTFLKQSKRYKNMSASYMRELAELKARAAERLARNLISPDTPDFVAWPRVINEEILEVQGD